MFDRIFLSHPRTVGETYVQHLIAASGFGISMILGGTACIVHALVPSLFISTASDRISSLHDKMVQNRRRKALPENELSKQN